MAKETSRGKEKRGGLKNHLGILGPGVVITILGFIIAYQFVEPAPPRTITIATGDKSGAYYAFAQRYREILARDGVALEIRNTAGSVENVKLLGAKEGGWILPLCKAASEIPRPNQDFDHWPASISSPYGSFTTGTRK